MRQFSYITLGKILEELWEEAKKTKPQEEWYYLDTKGNVKKRYPITRMTFYRLEKRLNFPETQKTTGLKPWRTYTREEADEIKQKIKKEYNLE